MKNANRALFVAVIASLLMIGTSIIPMQSYADRDDDDDNKKDNDFKSKTSKIYESDKKSANQDQDQDNFCYMDDEICTQASDGQQLFGTDNDAIGFNDQSNNLPPVSSGTGSGIGNGNGNGGGTNTNPSFNTFNFFSTTTNNNVNLTLTVDNSICDQSNLVNTAAADIFESAGASQSATSSAGFLTVDFTNSSNPSGNATATISLPITISQNTTQTITQSQSASASAAASQSPTCTVTLTDSPIGPGGITGISSVGPSISLNPTGGPCAAPLLNGVITTTNPVRTLDVCVSL